jgi:GNAT superfamily N-acetyltransferase
LSNGQGRSEGILIRAAKEADIERLAVLCGQLGYPASAGQVRQRLDELLQVEDHAVLVAEGPDGQVIGWVHVFVRQLLVVDRHAELGGLVVDEGHRGRGVGRLLMETAEDWASARGCEALYMRSKVVREQAHRFYEGIGYDLIKRSCVFLKELGRGK